MSYAGSSGSGAALNVALNGATQGGGPLFVQPATLKLQEDYVKLVYSDGSDGHPVAAPMSRFDALIDACHKRARPIVMTTIAMGAGMLPLAVGWGSADSSFRSPMAVAVIGGLMTSTVLSLLVIPSVFTVMDDFEHLLGRIKTRVFGAKRG